MSIPANNNEIVDTARIKAVGTKKLHVTITVLEEGTLTGNMIDRNDLDVTFVLSPTWLAQFASDKLAITDAFCQGDYGESL